MELKSICTFTETLQDCGTVEDSLSTIQRPKAEVGYYRADDSYFSFARNFVSNAITLPQLQEAMRLGKLGEQMVLKSEQTFRQIRFLEAKPAAANEYYAKKAARDRAAQKEYRSRVRSQSHTNELLMIDIMREGIKDGDERLF